jgi:phosphatidylethanolamine/phosphatidyl-N-methylethanolamine N-methyltransferase
MSLLFFKRVLANPLQVGYLVPSSPFLTRQVARRFDFSAPRVVVELGPGEGCHSRQILKRMSKDSRLILLELDPEFVTHLRKQFAGDDRVTVIHGDARDLSGSLEELSLTRCDYILSGIPFFLIKGQAKVDLLESIARAMDENTKFLTYQVSLQLADETHLFSLQKKEYCPLNVPPINVLEFGKAAGAPGKNGTAKAAA